MFSAEQKKQISEKIEKILLDVGHPEMPLERPDFELHVVGKDSWSWAKIEPNWKFKDREPSINPHNEAQDIRENV